MFYLRGKPGTRFEAFTFSLTADNVFDEYFFNSSGGTGTFNGGVNSDYGRTLTFAMNARF